MVNRNHSERIRAQRRASERRRASEMRSSNRSLRNNEPYEEPFDIFEPQPHRPVELRPPSYEEPPSYASRKRKPKINLFRRIIKRLTRKKKKGLTPPPVYSSPALPYQSPPNYPPNTLPSYQLGGKKFKKNKTKNKTKNKKT